MKKKILLIAATLLVSGFAYSQSDAQLKLLFMKEQSLHVIQFVESDTVQSKNDVFIKPRDNGDVLVRCLIQSLDKEHKEFRDYCKGKGDIEMDYEIKYYQKSKFLSAIEHSEYFCGSMGSPGYTVRTYNFFLFEGKVYAVVLNGNSKEFNEIVKKAVLAHFDKDCTEDMTIDNNYHVYFDKGIFIDDPLNNKMCDDALEIPQAEHFLLFKKIQ